LKKLFHLCLLHVSVSLIVSGCTSLREPESNEPPYRWSNFFNNKCGPMLQFKLNSEDEAILSYPCSNGLVVSQAARLHQQQGKVKLWVTSDLPREQLYQLSRSKCRASLIYLGPVRATVKFPCALVHLTATCDIVNKETMDVMTAIQLQPTKVLITFSDGIQEFRLEEDLLIPLGPLKPFKGPRPSLPMALKQDNRT
jgi:hypothetical protein